ncbi:Immunoglobulin super DCC subclass member 3 [Desmophyllum pertusum]|uniref:Immunoglobulin super DCC subclass member 3 n=1 Tax=Desmophyllum pertusum TaxID=174260 RepID=A0A9W9Z498_9CNID|nr:Immunoglobulin super DCC subclass member 3 [Desmophyllum pertusum]
MREGDKLSLHISVSGNPAPKITWSFQGRDLDNRSRFKFTAELFEISDVRFEDQGKITCLVENVFGSQVAHVKVLVFGTPRFPTSPPGQVIGFLGKATKLQCDAYSLRFYSTPPASISVSSIRESLRVSCAAKGSPLPTVTWYRNTVSMHVINKVTEDLFTSELVIGEFQPADQATYRCVARNVYNDTVETSSRIFLPNCGNPGKPENSVIINSNHWAGEYVRFLCHPGYTMRGPAVRRCLPSGNWSGTTMQCTNVLQAGKTFEEQAGTDESPECVNHTVIDDYTRQVNYKGFNNRCDNKLAEGWYRFTNGKHLNNKCKGSFYCDTYTPGWLTRAHPSVGEGRVIRQDVKLVL